MVQNLVVEVANNLEMFDRISAAEGYIDDAKKKSKEQMSITLPDPRTIRYAHHVASCYIEGEIGKEITMSKDVFLMPDGTSRSKVGKIGGCLVHVENKVRSIETAEDGGRDESKLGIHVDSPNDEALKSLWFDSEGDI